MSKASTDTCARTPETGTERETKQATGKQLVAIIFILALATKMFMLPISLIQTAGRDGYIALAIWCAVDLVALGAILSAMHFAGDADFFELLVRVFGKVGARIVAAFAALFLFFKLNVASGETLSFYSHNVFSDFNVPVLTIIMLVFFIAAASHTLRALCRLNELFIPIITVCLVLLAAIVIMTGFDFANILPTLREPAQFGESAFRHAAWLGDFTPLLLFIGRTRTKKHTLGFAAASGVLGASVAVFFAIVMCAAFGNVPVLTDSTTNISSIIQYSVGNVYGRVDLFSSVLWSISAFIETALFFYAVCRCVEFVIGRGSHFAVGVCVAVALYFTLVFVMTDPTLFSVAVKSYAAAAITIFFSVALPAVALACAIIKRKRERVDGIADANRGEKENP